MCISYKYISTGLTIYLFDIHNITIFNNKTIFNINAYSYCPIDKSMNFNINFDNFNAYCNFKYSNNISTDKYSNNNLNATCFVDTVIENFDDYYFPFAYSENNIQMKIFNYRKNLKFIFKDFYCKENNKCILLGLFYQNAYRGYHVEIKINNNQYICKLNKEIIYLNNDNYHIEKGLDCEISSNEQINKI